MLDVNYKVSLYKSVALARWNINKDKGNVFLYVSKIWDMIDKTNIFAYFVEWCIYFTLIERICLERAYNKIKIKGGRCNPCCVEKITSKIYGFL